MISWKALSGVGLAAALIAAGCSSSSHNSSNTIPTRNAPTPTTATTTTNGSQLPAGYYVDGPDSRPHYVLSVTSAPGGFAGWIFFVYQDGHISETLHYHSTSVVPDLLLAVKMVTDTTNEPFPYPHVSPGSLVGSEPVPPGQTLGGTYDSTGLSLSNCGTYLYWANPANISEPMSCTFSFSGSNTR